MKKYELPNLPYDYGDLEPVISQEIMEFHHQRHHKTYVMKLNEALEKYEEAQGKGDLEEMIALEPQIRFNGGGHINHTLFWKNLTPLAKKKKELPTGQLEHAIKKRFGSFNAFQQQFTELTLTIPGSGWGWLGACSKTGCLRIAACPNQDPLQPTRRLVPLFGVDVWEHAYYLQYKNNRTEYLKNIWEIVDWCEVEERFSLFINHLN